MSNKHKSRWIIVAGIAVLTVVPGVFAFILWGKPESGHAEFKVGKAAYKAEDYKSAVEHYNWRRIGAI